MSGALLKLNIGYGALAPFEIKSITNTKYIAGKINKIEIFCLLVSFSSFPVNFHLDENSQNINNGVTICKKKVEKIISGSLFLIP